MQVHNVKMIDNQFLQAVLPIAKSCLGVSSARLLALPALLASEIGAKNALNGMVPENEIPKSWKESISGSENANLVSRLIQRI